MKKYGWVFILLVAISLLMSCAEEEKQTLKVLMLPSRGTLPFSALSYYKEAKIDWLIDYASLQEIEQLIESDEIFDYDAVELDIITFFKLKEAYPNIKALWMLQSVYGIVLGQGKTKEDLLNEPLGLDPADISVALVNLWLADTAPLMQNISNIEKREQLLDEHKITAAFFVDPKLGELAREGYQVLVDSDMQNQYASTLVYLKADKETSVDEEELFRKMLDDYFQGLELYNTNSTLIDENLRDKIPIDVGKGPLSEQIFFDNDLFDEMSYFYKVNNPKATVFEYSDLFWIPQAALDSSN